ncbi:MAG: DUF3187 family protein [Thermoanaerobaculia bacterium]|nr:DUF3187 family protein [Thermoanaerobaculia bacterium]
MPRVSSSTTALLCLLLLSAPAPADDGPADDGKEPLVAGSLEVRVQNPLWLIFPRLGAAPIDLPPAGRGEVAWRSDYSSFFRVDERQGTDLASLDGEIWRNTFAARVGLGRDLALWVEVPILYGTGGFLDHLVEEYHETFGFDQEGRDENPDDQFAFLLIHDRRLAFELVEDATEPGDVSVGIDWRLPERGRSGPAVTLRAAVELPSGDESRGFGSGEVEAGLGVTVHRSWTRYRLTGSLARQLQRTPEAFERAAVETRHNWVADLVLERGFGRNLALVVQWGYEQSPLLGAALPASDDSSGTLTLGGAWRPAPRWRIDFAFLEDIDGETTQDFTGHFAVRRSF